jgi:hypothetical protein
MTFMVIREARSSELEAVGEIRVAAYVADNFLAPDSEYAPTLRALGTSRWATLARGLPRYRRTS